MQALIGLTIFSDGSLDDKIHTLYTAFDQDGGGEIDRKELSTFLSASIISMCRIVDLPSPSRLKINEYTFEIFRIVDKNGNGIVDYKEFSSWIKESDTVQDFLLKYTGIQTYEMAKRRCTEIFDLWVKEFDNLSVEFCGTRYVEINILTKRFHVVMKEISPDIREKMFLLFSYEGNSLLSEEDFQSIVASWAAFSATDINNDNELDINELKILLWLKEGCEPSGSKVSQAMSSIDFDGHGTIDRLEWIKYLVCPAGEDGSGYFDYELRKKFDKHDSNKNGSIEMGEFICFLKAELSEFTAGLPLNEQDKVKDVFVTLAHDCMVMLYDSAGQKDVKINSKSDLNWNIFKKMNLVCRKKIETTGNFIAHFFKKA